MLFHSQHGGIEATAASSFSGLALLAPKHLRAPAYAVYARFSERSARAIDARVRKRGADALIYRAGSRNLVATASVTAPLASPRLCTTTIGRLATERPYKSQTA